MGLIIVDQLTIYFADIFLLKFLVVACVKEYE